MKPKRQREMLAEMGKAADYSATFARAMVVKTPSRLRSRSRRKRNPWRKSAAKTELVTKQEEVEKRHDFYSRLYSQYSTDLLKLTAYVRKLATNNATRAYLEEHLVQLLARFQEIVFEPEASRPKP